jgi:hypothetical protein
VADTYVVVVEHNLVTAVHKLPEGSVAAIPETKLEIGTELANNYRTHGCIDGRYHFENAQRARVFATLCLEFARALVDKRLDAIKSLTADSDYRASDPQPIAKR